MKLLSIFSRQAQNLWVCRSIAINTCISEHEKSQLTALKNLSKAIFAIRNPDLISPFLKQSNLEINRFVVSQQNIGLNSPKNLQ